MSEKEACNHCPTPLSEPKRLPIDEGTNINACANMMGITPEAFSLSGMY